MLTINDDCKSLNYLYGDTFYYSPMSWNTNHQKCLIWANLLFEVWKCLYFIASEVKYLSTLNINLSFIFSCVPFSGKYRFDNNKNLSAAVKDN